MEKFNLCCDCLAINEFGIDICPKCGGDTCWCEGCQNTGKMLLAGVRDKDLLGIKESIAYWNPETGCI